MARLTVEEVINRGVITYAELSIDAAGGAERALDLYNAKAAELHNLLVNADENYAVKTTGEVTLDSHLMALPADFKRARKVFIVDNGRHYPATRFTPDEVDGHDIDSITTGIYDLWYVPQYAKVKDKRAEVPLITIDGWEEYVAWSMAATLIGKRGEDVTFAASERNRLKADIVAQAEPRDEVAGGIADVHDRWGERGSSILGFQQGSGLIRYYSIEGNYIRFLEVQ